MLGVESPGKACEGSTPSAVTVKRLLAVVAVALTALQVVGVPTTFGGALQDEYRTGSEAGDCVTFVLTTGNDRLAMACEVYSWPGSLFGSAGSSGSSKSKLPNVRSTDLAYHECGGSTYSGTHYRGPMTGTPWGDVPSGFVVFAQATNAACNGLFRSSPADFSTIAEGDSNAGCVGDPSSAGNCLGTIVNLARGGTHPYGTSGWFDVHEWLGAFADEADAASVIWSILDPSPSAECTTVDLSWSFYDLLDAEWIDLDNPAGVTVTRGDRIRVEIDWADDAAFGLGFSIRWQRNAPWIALQSANDTTITYPVVYELEKQASDGPPSDMSAVELFCHGEDGNYYHPASSTSGWSTESQEARPCANIIWTWPVEREFVDDGATLYGVVGQFATQNGGTATVDGLYLDRDDPSLTAPLGRLGHIDVTDSDSYELEIDELYAQDGSTLAELAGSGVYNPPDSVPRTFSFFFAMDAGGVGETFNASTFGVWCDDSIGPPILYRFDSTYEASDDLDPSDGSSGGRPSLSECFGDALGSMSLTSPVSWVTGIGRMSVCLVQWLFIPAGVGATIGGFIDELESQFPFSLGFVLIDFAAEMGDALDGASGSGCFDMGGDFSFGSFDVPVDDMCVGDGLTVGSTTRDLLAALMIAPILFAVCRHALRLVRGVNTNDAD